MPFSCFFNVWFTWGANTMCMDVLPMVCFPGCKWIKFPGQTESCPSQRRLDVGPHKSFNLFDKFEDSQLRTLWLYDIWMPRILAQDIRNDRHWCFSVGRLESHGFLWFPGELLSTARQCDFPGGGCWWSSLCMIGSCQNLIILKYFETYILNSVFWMFSLRPAGTNAITTKTAALNGSKSNVKLFDKVLFA